MSAPIQAMPQVSSCSSVRESSRTPWLWRPIITDAAHDSWMYAKRPDPSVTLKDLEVICEQTPWEQSGGSTQKIAWMVTGGCKCSLPCGSMTVRPTPITPWMRSMMQRWLHDVCQNRMPNSVELVTCGNDASSSRWHSSAVPSLATGRTCVIYVSLGATRFHQVCPRAKLRGVSEAPEEDVVDCWLSHGDMCLMDGHMHKHYLHRSLRGALGAVAEEPRVTITFRWITEHEEACPLSTAKAGARTARSPGRSASPMAVEVFPVGRGAGPMNSRAWAPRYPV
eukprot:NODE_7389_length_1583_cov_7.555632.p1 GENE.NODE_7389_length_1583_cov_7.555632~~NODE_7389_length_1583_cov_7.555632.p1  ORF type:complete len:281 (-),score=25.41 NODE_7389_length_1583_cov_7.555632:185-1027(-)